MREEGGSPLSYGGELLPDGTESPMEERVERGEEREGTEAQREGKPVLGEKDVTDS